ncbi:adenylosuccinate lyase [Lentisalinibacter salinarum]|uniref:adenylosuccinate lyase n=1 Tax=Lentisalinibacter salinarum TaxID=2992239 RepID=UPI0038702AEF
MELTTLRAISPVDGRYASKAAPLRDVFSEFGLIHFRVLVEVRWLQFLADEPSIAELPPLPGHLKDMLNRIVDGFAGEDAARIKAIEATTNHDVKAVEYFLGERLGEGADAATVRGFIHFGCTSEDVNNLAYALMLRHGRDDVLLPAMRELGASLDAMARQHAGLAMLSRTHGQTASPTTLGKEIANFAERLRLQRRGLQQVAVRGKFNGAVGNFNAHAAAYPEADWPALSARFVESLGLAPNAFTTQIEPHDWIAEYCHALSRYNTVLTDLCRDVWGYISLGYFRQRRVEGEVGSSTMPHKINPIDFENAEGNLGVANALLGHFADKLPISRWQRDLTDSTVLRNLGVALAHSLIAIESARRGLGKLQADPDRIGADLEGAWEVLGEAVQTVMRRYGVDEPYEKLKALTRGRRIDREAMAAFIRSLEIPEAEKERLLALTPSTYTGLAESLARSR